MDSVYFLLVHFTHEAEGGQFIENPLMRNVVHCASNSPKMMITTQRPTMNRVCLERDIRMLPFSNPVEFVQRIDKLSIGLLECVDLDVQRRSLVSALVQECIESWRADQFEVPQTFIKGFHVSLLGRAKLGSSCNEDGPSLNSIGCMLRHWVPLSK